MYVPRISTRLMPSEAEVPTERTWEGGTVSLKHRSVTRYGEGYLWAVIVDCDLRVMVGILSVEEALQSRLDGNEKLARSAIGVEAPPSEAGLSRLEVRMSSGIEDNRKGAMPRVLARGGRLFAVVYVSRRVRVKLVGG